MHHDGMFLLHLFIKIFKFNNNLFLTLWRLLCLPVYSWSSLQHWWQVDTWLSRAGRVSHLITVQLHSWLDYYIYIKWAMTLWLTDWLAWNTVQRAFLSHILLLLLTLLHSCVGHFWNEDTIMFPTLWSLIWCLMLDLILYTVCPNCSALVSLF